MLPEVSERKAITLYMAKDFPYNWIQVRNLLENIDAADTVIHYHLDTWFLFVSVDDTIYRDHGSELHIYYTDDLLNGDLFPHPQNPICLDASVARSAGPIVSKNNAIYRPSQRQGFAEYGKAINLMKITELTKQTYAEELHQVITLENLTKYKKAHHLMFGKKQLFLDVHQ